MLHVLRVQLCVLHAACCAAEHVLLVRSASAAVLDRVTGTEVNSLWHPARMSDDVDG